MKLYSYLIICLFLFLYAGCFRPPSTEDNEKLNQLINRYGDTFDFKLTGEFYLLVKLKKDIQISENDLIEIYNLFFFKPEEDSQLRKTSFVYLNFYDFRGKFQYQLVYSTKSKRYVKGEREFY